VAFLADQVEKLAALAEVAHDVVVGNVLVKFVDFQDVYVVLMEFM
jgi:hypothetical protein